MSVTEPVRRSTLWLGGALSLVGLQAGLLAYFGGAVLLSRRPSGGLDYETHASQTWRVLEGLQGWGRSWVYDVHHLAGMPTGVLFDADNKGWELLTFVLESLGMSRGAAFNTFIVLSHMLVGPIIYATARVFGLRPLVSWLAAIVAVLYWNFDSWCHWVWYVGMISWGLASCLSLLPLALFYRWLRRRRSLDLLAVALLLPVCHLVHPYSFLILVVPMTVLYARAWTTLQPRDHAAVWGIALLTVLANLYWLLVAFRFWHYLLDSSLFAETGVSSLLWDTIGVLTAPASTGIIGKRTALRTCVLLAAIVGVVVFRRRADARATPFAVTLATLLALAYLGGHTFLAQTQPYRHTLPAGFIAIVIAAAVVELARREHWWITMSRRARAALALMAMPATLFIGQDVLYFTAPSLPEPEPLPHGERVAMSPLGFPPHAFYAYGDWYAEDLAAFVREQDDGTGRFMVEGWAWGEQLTWSTDAQILGGFIWRNVPHSWANFFRRRPQGIAKDAELRQYLQTYAVSWVILSSPKARIPWWDRSPLLQHVRDIRGFRIYRVREPSGFIVAGPGRVRARTNVLEVEHTDPETPVELRYHFLETLVCEPGCTIERTKVPSDPVGFIRVPAPHPSDFVIRNAY